MVGQEYTDFDKGLDDGIEGDVFGFNFVLSSTQTIPMKPAGYPLRRRFDGTKPWSQPVNTYQFPLGSRLNDGHTDLDIREIFPLRREAAGVQGRFSRSIFQDVMSLFDTEVQSSRILTPNRFYAKIPPFSHELTNRRISNEAVHDGSKPLGLLLVELSFDCAFKKGAPLSEKGVLVSWTKSPVRVFGGAILKKVQPFCRRMVS